MKEPNILYYYCNIKTLNEILDKQSILLTDMTKSNDADEFHFIFEMYRKYLYIKHGKDYSLPIELNIKEFKKANISIRPMARCFTTKKDDLSMWRAYGDDGKGVCIGFEFKSLLETLSNCKVQDKNIELKKVEYIDKNTKNKDKLNRLFKDCKDEEFIINNFNTLLELSLFNKNKIFKQEDEWRIGVNAHVIKTEKDDRSNLEFSSDIGFYIRITINLDSISEIIIGPKCKYKIEDMLPTLKYFYGDNRLYDLTDIVEESKLSYRNRI